VGAKYHLKFGLKFEEKVLCGSHRHLWKDNIEMYFELVKQYVDCIPLALSGDQ
jgi:hypothetical protein